MNNLKAARVRRGLTQSELADASAVHASEVSRFETGQARPYPSQAARLGAVLGIPPDQLLADSGETVEIRSVQRRVSR